MELKNTYILINPDNYKMGLKNTYILILRAKSIIFVKIINMT